MPYIPIIKTLGLMVSDKQFFFMFSVCNPMKHVPPGVGPLWPQWHNLNKLGTYLLGDATYQLLRHEAIWFQIRRIFHVFHYVSQCKA